MTERYDNTAATHYAAFRPAIHPLVLERLLLPGESFRAGLDIGCGTGYSAVALARYCDRVFGVDSSQAMLESAARHPKVAYVNGSGDALDELQARDFDVVSFAGSLFYTKSAGLRHGLASLCSPGALVLVYDFEVLLDGVMAALGVESVAVASDYDYHANLADWPEVEVEHGGTDRLRIVVTARQMAHLLFADSNRHDALSGRFPDGDLFEAVVALLGKETERVELEVDIYFTRYRVSRNCFAVADEVM